MRKESSNFASVFSMALISIAKLEIIKANHFIVKSIFFPKSHTKKVDLDTPSCPSAPHNRDHTLLVIMEYTAIFDRIIGLIIWF